jgi:hypothetical protein
VRQFNGWLTSVAAWAVVTWIGLACETTEAAELVGRWPLVQNEKEIDQRVATTARAIEWSDEGGRGKVAQFDGKASRITVEANDALDFGKEDFTCAVWIQSPEEGADLPGSIISQWDEAARQGWSLSLVTNNASPTTQSNRRQLEFALLGGAGEANWQDHGRPGKAVYIISFCTFDGALYCSTCENGPGEFGHVWRWNGNDGWVDCGTPGQTNAVSGLIEFQGELYAACSRYRLRGSALPESENQRPGGRVYRMAGPSDWIEVGQLPEVEAINGLVVYRNRLYASSTYSPGVFRYESEGAWTRVGTPEGKRVEAMAVHDGFIFGTGYDAGEVYRYDGETWSVVGRLPETTQTYGFATFSDDLFVSSWPTATVFRYRGGNEWEDCGRPGEERESMGLVVYAGSLLTGTLPLAEVYRYERPRAWSSIGRLDFTPDVTYRRTWCFGLFGGRVFCGVLPSGHVWSCELGKSVLVPKALPGDWQHVTAVRREGTLEVYLNGELTERSTRFDPEAFPWAGNRPVEIGWGPHGTFSGRMRDVRLYRGALTPAEIGALAGE